MNIYKNENKNMKSKFVSIIQGRELNNSFWLMSERIISMALNLIIVYQLARFYGPEEYGALNYALSFIILFTSISTLGLETISVKMIVDKTIEVEKILKTSLYLRILSSFFLIIITFALINFLNPNDHKIQLIVILLSISLIFKSFDVIDYWVQANHLAKYSAKIKICTSIIITILKLTIIFNESQIEFIAFAYIIEAILIGLGLVLLYKYKSNAKRFNWKFDLDYAKKSLKMSWPLIISGLMVAIYTKIDQIMIGNILNSSSEVGYYSAAIQISSMWYFIPLSLITSFNPSLMKHKNNEKLFTKKYIEFYSIILWLSIFFCTAITVFSSPIINLLFGVQYEKSISVLTISVWGGVIALLGSARSVWLISYQLQSYSIIYLGVGAVCNVILNWIMIPHLGIQGAAYASLISQSISVLIVPFIFYKTRKSVLMMFKSINFIKILKNRSNL